MNLLKRGANAFQLMYNRDTDSNMPMQTIVLFSFGTPVAARLPDGTYIKTSFDYGQTTKIHIGKFIGSKNKATVRTVDQWTITNIVNANWDELPKKEEQNDKLSSR